MKIPASVRQLYENQKAINDRLKEVVDKRMQSLKNPRWHYESRVKELQSYALKIESGRFTNPDALEDFFACTIVVQNAIEVSKAEALIRDSFTVKNRRPPNAIYTDKASNAFPFDDLRLYATLPDNPLMPPTDLDKILFEAQIKTFLQHAWSIATHDMLYKSDGADWSKERIAFQIKAMLEHAEISIQEADSLAKCHALGKENRETAALNKGIALLKSQWGIDELPKDVRRLASNLLKLNKLLSINIQRLEEILNQGKAERGGNHPLNLSPYSIIIQYLFRIEKEKMVTFLKKIDSDPKILIPREIELPEDVDRSQLRSAVFV